MQGREKKNRAILLNKFDCYFEQVIKKKKLYEKKTYRNSWTLDARVGRWTLNARLWTLEAGLCTLDSARWTLHAGLWTLDSEHWTLDATFWTLDAGLWILDAGR